MWSPGINVNTTIPFPGFMKLLWRSWIPCWWLWTAWSMWENWKVCIIISCVSSHRHQIDEWEPHKEQGLTSEPKKLSECRTTTIPSHHPVVDCTDYYETNLPVLEIFQTAQLPRIILPFPQKNMVFVCFWSISTTKKPCQFMSSFPQKHSPNPRDSQLLLGLQSWPEEQVPMQVSMSESYHELPKTWIFKSKIRKKKHKYLDSLKEVGKKLIPQMVLNSDLPWLNQYKNTTKKSHTCRLSLRIDGSGLISFWAPTPIFRRLWLVSTRVLHCYVTLLFV